MANNLFKLSQTNIWEYLAILHHTDNPITRRLRHRTSITKTRMGRRIILRRTQLPPIVDDSLDIVAVMRTNATAGILAKDLMDTTICPRRVITAVLTIASGRLTRGIATSTGKPRSPPLHDQADDCHRALEKTTILTGPRIVSGSGFQGRSRTQKTVIRICRRQRATRAHLEPQEEAGDSALLSRPRLLLLLLPSRFLISPNGCRPGNHRLGLLNPLEAGCPAVRRRLHRGSSPSVLIAIETGRETGAGSGTGAATVRGAVIVIEAGIERGAEIAGISGKDAAASVSPGAGVITGEKTVDLRVAVKGEEVTDGQISDPRGLANVSQNRRTCRQNRGNGRQSHLRSSRRS